MYTVGDPNTADVVVVQYIGDSIASLTYPHGKCTITCISDNSGFIDAVILITVNSRTLKRLR